MRVQLIDPSADVLPYDHALAAALARCGAQVELVTSRFVHGPAPAPDGYEVSESFYRLATRLGARPCAERSRRPSTCPARCACAAAPQRPTSSTGSGSGSRR